MGRGRLRGRGKGGDGRWERKGNGRDGKMMKREMTERSARGRKRKRKWKRGRKG